MKVTLTAVTACQLPAPFGMSLAIGESTPPTYIKFSDIMSDKWHEIVQLRQKGVITMAMAVDAVPVFDDELFIMEMGKIRDNAGAPVTNLAALRAVTQDQRIDRQLRLVETENNLYRFDLGTLAGGETPDDVNDGNWFNLGTVAAVWGLLGELVGITPGAAASIGAVAKLAKIDHVHAPAMGLVGELAELGPDEAPAVGATNKFAAIAHTHAVKKAAVGTIANIGAAKAEGAHNSFARGDHVHAIGAGILKTEDIKAADAVKGGLSFMTNFSLLAAGAAEGKLWDANCPVKCFIVDVTVIASATSGAGTVTLYDGDPSGGGAAITGPIDMAADHAVTRLSSVVGNAEVAALGTLWYKKNAAADAGIVILTCVVVP